jgi:hypothetical protein
VNLEVHLARAYYHLYYRVTPESAIEVAPRALNARQRPLAFQLFPFLKGIVPPYHGVSLPSEPALVAVSLRH